MCYNYIESFYVNFWPLEGIGSIKCTSGTVHDRTHYEINILARAQLDKGTEHSVATTRKACQMLNTSEDVPFIHEVLCTCFRPISTSETLAARDCYFYYRKGS